MVATLAEANFLAEKYAIAFALYEQACTFDVTGGRWARTIEQLRLHLESLSDPKVTARFAPILSGKTFQAPLN